MQNYLVLIFSQSDSLIMTFLLLSVVTINFIDLKLVANLSQKKSNSASAYLF